MIELPWPSSDLAGHNSKHYRFMRPIIKKHRAWAHAATLAAKITGLPDTGDIMLSVTFNPPNRRGDRLNYPNRCKAYFDGIADALKVNDRRFVPHYVFGEVVPNGRITIEICSPPDIT